jgi:hypothetical protein
MTGRAAGTLHTGVWIVAWLYMAVLRAFAQVNAIASAFACVGGCRHRGEENGSGSGSGGSDDGACDCAPHVLQAQREAGVALWILRVSSHGVAWLRLRGSAERRRAEFSLHMPLTGRSAHLALAR